MITAVKETSDSGFSWELIAKQVKSRNAVQCLRKWCKGCGLIEHLSFIPLRHQHMCWKSSGSSNLIKWSREDEVRLIQELVLVCNGGRGSNNVVDSGNQWLLMKMR